MIPSGARPYRAGLLLVAGAIGALCGIVYELLLASLASYLVGSPVVVFSLTVGGFMAAMGLGAYLSRFLHKRLLGSFLSAQLTLATLGGSLPLALFAVYVANGPFVPLQVVATVLLGVLVGLELPLLTRMLERTGGVREAIAQALALDYLGALAGSLLFPLVLLPTLGLLATAAATGALGAGAALAVVIGHAGALAKRRKVWLLVATTVVTALLGLAIPARRLGNWLENRLYDAPIVARAQSRFQRLVLTRYRGDIRLFLDGSLQFSSIDEHRYHEALVHPAMSLHPRPRRVLLLGAGDGLALREILKYPELEKVTLIELDRTVIDLARQHPALVELNQRSLDDPRVEVVIGDAFPMLRDRIGPVATPYDVIIADFPDPENETIARLYSTAFYGWARRALKPDGLLVTQSSSPFFVPDAFLCVAETLRSAGFRVRSYNVDVPSFGPWGFHLAWPASGDAAPDPSRLELRVNTRYLTPALARNLFDLPGDLRATRPLKPNRLLEPVLVRYHRDEQWHSY